MRLSDTAGSADSKGKRSDGAAQMKRRRPKKAIPAEHPKPPAETGVRARAARLLIIVDRDIDRLSDPKSKLNELQRYRMQQSLANLLTQLGKLTGEGLEIPDSKLVKLPGFRRVAEKLIAALSPWPDALRAAGQALTEIEEERTLQ
jgi:hypothetical protein